MNEFFETVCLIITTEPRLFINRLGHITVFNHSSHTASALAGFKIFTSIFVGTYLKSLLFTYSMGAI